MEIYFSCSLTGGRDDAPVYQQIVAYLLGRGFTVPTHHLAHPDVMHQEQIVDPFEVFQRDINWLNGCDAVVAEVSTPSHGVGYEIAYALGLEKPVLCCFKEGTAVSKMITGNTTFGLTLASYRAMVDLIPRLDAFLSTNFASSS
ncbi:MAG: nucleoside 2-deoxyribosyltransferase [Anaerolineales bacterium]|nr:nucleoside 2-deoxyribosyltransferase [Anaerolineales bacterium]